VRAGPILFQPISILELEVYHNELKNLQRIKEFKWSHLYTSLFFDVRKNAVALFMVELLQKCLKQPEENPELYSFAEDAFIHLDKSTGCSNRKLSFIFCYTAQYFFSDSGWKMSTSETHNILDLREGRFVTEHPDHQQYLEDPLLFYHFAVVARNATGRTHIF
jgi:DNA repair protein RecO (recombination protein O)